MFYSSFHFLVIVSLLLLPTITIHNFLQWSTCERITGRIGEISAERERARIGINVIRVFLSLSLSMWGILSHSRSRTNWQHTFLSSTAKELNLKIFGRKFSKYVNFMVSTDNKTYFFLSAFKTFLFSFRSNSNSISLWMSFHIWILIHFLMQTISPLPFIRNAFSSFYTRTEWNSARILASCSKAVKLWLGEQKRFDSRINILPNQDTFFSVYFDVWMSFWTAMKNSSICTK